jgi:hypothetical protein
MAHYTHGPVSATRHLLAALALGAPLAAAGADPIGAETCKACHPVAFEVWRESAHARAEARLPERSRSDPRCTACHAPEPGQAGVSCEACHGNGALYARAYVMRDRELARALGLVDPGERTCQRCHDDSAPSLSRFDYAKKLPLVRHAEAEREARRAAGRAAATPGAAR